MAYQDRRVSLCHFSPTSIAFINQTSGDRVTDEREIYAAQASKDPNVKQQVVCDYCDKICRFVPDFLIDYDAMEMTIRRYKDGDLKYEDVQDILAGQIKGTILDLLYKISNLKYEEKA